MKKKLMLFLFVFVLLFANVGAVSASGVRYDANVTYVYVDEFPIVFSDAFPVVKSSRTFIPLRAVSEGLGLDVKWDNKSQKATVSKSDMDVALTVGSKTMTVNGKKVTSDVAPFMHAGRVFVPLRFISEAFGYDVGYSEDWGKKMIEITTDKSRDHINVGGIKVYFDEIDFSRFDIGVDYNVEVGVLENTYTPYFMLGGYPVDDSGNHDYYGQVDEDVIDFVIDKFKPLISEAHYKKIKNDFSGKSITSGEIYKQYEDAKGKYMVLVSLEPNYFYIAYVFPSVDRG